MTSLQRVALLLPALSLSACGAPAGNVQSLGSASSTAAISITSDADFANCGCVSSGAGTQASPYVIGPLSINAASGEAGIYINGAKLTRSFILRNVTIAGNSSSPGIGIELVSINPSGSQSIAAEVAGASTSIQTCSTGILVQGSSWVTLDGGGENPNGPGVTQGGQMGTINKNSSGAIDLENSSHITVKGWQMSANGPSTPINWVTFDPSVSAWNVGGIRLFGVTSSTLDHNAVNNSTDVSITLFNSSHNTVSNNTGDYPYQANLVVTDGSSYNSITGNAFGTGDFLNILVADPLPGSATLKTYGETHDNLISGNVTHSAGPTGAELSPVSIAPAFLGGLVLLNGTYNNQVTNNNSWGNTSFDLAWAQAVPSSSTPIGVATYPPALVCNVTASGGGGGVNNLNGNVWSGNTFKKIAPCLPPQ